MKSRGILEITFVLILILLLVSSLGFDKEPEIDGKALYNEMYELMSDALLIELSPEMLKDKELVEILQEAELHMDIDKLEPADNILEDYGFGYMQYVGDPDMIPSWIKVGKEDREMMKSGELTIEDVADELLSRNKAYEPIHEIVSSLDGGFLIISSGLVDEERLESAEGTRELIEAKYPELTKVLSSSRGFLVHDAFYMTEEELEEAGFVDSLEDFGNELNGVEDVEELEDPELDPDTSVSSDGSVDVGIDEDVEDAEPSEGGEVEPGSEGDLEE